MARAALETFAVRQHYLSLVYFKPVGGSEILLGQLRQITPNQTSEKKEYARVGDLRKKVAYGSVATEISGLHIYWEDNLHELATVLGVPRPGGGWLGTEKIQLDTSKQGHFRVLNYDSTDEATAALQFTEYLNYFTPASLQAALDAEGDVRIAEITGACDEYYITPEAE
jgi:hypothetical protein